MRKQNSFLKNLAVTKNYFVSPFGVIVWLVVDIVQIAMVLNSYKFPCLPFWPRMWCNRNNGDFVVNFFLVVTIVQKHPHTLLTDYSSLCLIPADYICTQLPCWELFTNQMFQIPLNNDQGHMEIINHGGIIKLPHVLFK